MEHLQLHKLLLLVFSRLMYMNGKVSDTLELKARIEHVVV